MFLDEVVVEVYAGRGGHGMTSFRREKHVEYGGPSGGNGGRGSNIIFLGDEGKATLRDFSYRKHIKGKNGENGKSKGMHGANAPDEIIKVPLGTVVFDYETNQKMGEITYHGQELIVAKGGRGGRGNAAFQTSRNKAPRFSENGDLGETHKIKIELRVLADVGLLGFPNAGKSTLISVVSNARPKIANYPFTTLQPNLGMVNYKEKDFVIADLPGLVENAAEGFGLGIRFLKHLERCRIFLHLIDATEEEPLERYHIINNELAKYGKELINRKQIIVLNKIDLLKEDEINNLKALFNEEVIVISAASRIGINELLNRLIYELDTIPPIVKEDETHQVYELIDDGNTIDVTYEDGIYYLTGAKVELYYNRVNFSEDEGVRRFIQQLNTLGVEEVLRKKGLKDGDTVNIYGFEFEYFE